MPSITIRNIPDEVHRAIRVRAATHGRSAEAEVRFGLAAMPPGKRHTIDQERLEREVLPAFAGRVLPFDLDASKAYGELMARARAAGLAIGNAHGYIAATAAARGLMVATPDTSSFKAAGLAVIDPWAH